MGNIRERAETLIEFGKLISKPDHALKEILIKTENHNPWFTQYHQVLSLSTFAEHYFQKEKLLDFINNYDFSEDRNLTVGLVLAGNIPFVGMHDILCVFLSGANLKVKLSSKDQFFFPWMQKKISEIHPAFSETIQFVERLKDFDVAIATGSNNSSRYFHAYFNKYPHIIRKNRTSLAIIHGNETDEELKELGKDVFLYYGLGCRNVSKLYLPQQFDVTKLFQTWESYHYVIDHTKYKNNFDYNLALLLLNQQEHWANDFFILTESEKLFSPLSVLHFERYENVSDLQEKLNALNEDIQCIVTGTAGNTAFGKSQFPELADFADHIDTMRWLSTL